MRKTIFAFLAATVIPLVLLLGLFGNALSDFNQIISSEYPPASVCLFLAAVIFTPLGQLFLHFRYRKRDRKLAAGFLLSLLVTGLAFLAFFLRS